MCVAVFAKAQDSSKKRSIDITSTFKPVLKEKVGKGCRVVVATRDGTAYVADSAGGQLWVVKP